MKRQTISEIVADWPAEDVERFAELYDRFVASFDRRRQQFAEERQAEPKDGA